MGVATNYGIMLLNVFSTANFKTRHSPAYPTDSNCHDRLDDGGGSGISGCSMDGPQPGPTCLWRRQCYRTPLGDSCIVAVRWTPPAGRSKKKRHAGHRRGAVYHFVS